MRWKYLGIPVPPGSEYTYSITGYTLLGEIVKRVSGKSLREFTRERIFAPLGMNNTHFRDDHAEIVKHQAYGYVSGEKGGWKLDVSGSSVEVLAVVAKSQAEAWLREAGESK